MVVIDWCIIANQNYNTLLNSFALMVIWVQHRPSASAEWIESKRRTLSGIHMVKAHLKEWEKRENGRRQSPLIIWDF